MPSPSYRLLQIFSADARQSKESIDFEDLVWRVRENARKCNQVLGPRYTTYISKALKNFQSRRWIKIVKAEGGARDVNFTPSGMKHFRSWGISFVYTSTDAEPDKMTTMELQHQYLILDDVLQDAYEQFQGYQFDKPGCELTSLPDALSMQVKNMLKRQEELQKQYSELCGALSSDLAVERKLLQYLATLEAGRRPISP